jgi:hypothetical protein
MPSLASTADREGGPSTPQTHFKFCRTSSITVPDLASVEKNERKNFILFDLTSHTIYTLLINRFGSCLNITISFKQCMLPVQTASTILT